MPFPNMQDAFADWTLSTKFAIVEKSVVDFEVKETQLEYNIQGLFYPMKPQEILLKPEGQRTWKWWTLITLKLLKLDDIITDMDGKKYRVMAKYDYSNTGNFYQYELTQAFTNK